MATNTEVRNLTPLDQPRLWFGFATGICTWLGLGIADLLLAWKVCEAGPNSWGLVSKGSAIAIFAIITLILLGLTIAAGIVSFRNFRRITDNASLAHAEGTGRDEFMALGGMFISLALGIGIVWLGIPLFILDVCTRAR